MDLASEQQAILDTEIESLRDRLEVRKAVMALPTGKQVIDAIQGLRVAVDSVRNAAAAGALQIATMFSEQTSAWLRGGASVADELGKVKKREVHKVRGMTRPNRYRAWLIGDEIPALFALVFDGAALP